MHVTITHSEVRPYHRKQCQDTDIGLFALRGIFLGIQTIWMRSSDAEANLYAVTTSFVTEAFFDADDRTGSPCELMNRTGRARGLKCACCC